MAATRNRRVTIFGPCSATDHEVRRLAERGVTDAVLLAFAGSYTVVESTTDRTIVFTDIGHAWPIYTAKAMRGVVWGSSALALAALSGARPDPSWLAAALLAPHAPELIAGRSAFAGVSVIPPASRLVLEPGVRAQMLSGWSPEMTAVDVTKGTARLRQSLGDAVATRITTSRNPSADCSGGLDSASLTLLAADRLPDNGRLHAATVHPAGTNTGGDLDYARATIRASINITHLLCPLENRHAPFSHMQELMPPTDEPAPTTITVARAVAEFDLLREVGSDCHFTGDGGDTLLGGHPAYLADLGRRRQIRIFAHHLIGWARLRRIPVWSILAEALSTATTCRAAFLMALASELSGGECRRQRGLALAGWPFTDPQVIAACLSVPTWQCHTPYRYKPLLTTALADLLPAEIAARRTKGDFTPDHYLGLRANASALYDLADRHLAALDLIHPARLRRLLIQVEAGLPVISSDFEPALAAEVWLRAVSSATLSARWERCVPPVGVAP